MKKLNKVVLAIALLGMVSCAKEYTCDCELKHEQSGPGFSETQEWEESTDMTGKEDDMNSACGDMDFEKSYKDGAGYDQKITSKCDLK